MSVQVMPVQLPKTAIRERRNSLNAAEVADFVLTYQQAPLPQASTVFPWLHGISEMNLAQSHYFRIKHPTLDRNIHCSVPVLLPIKVGDPSNHFGSIVNSVYPENVLCRDDHGLIPLFASGNPSYGVCLRNFSSQAAKCAPAATILVYSFDPSGQDLVDKVAVMMSQARDEFFKDQNGETVGKILTFTGSASEIEKISPSLISYSEQLRYSPTDLVDLKSLKNWDTNFDLYERLEILQMSRASSIGESMPECGNVWLGNASDCAYPSPMGVWETLVDCLDDPDLPSIATLDHHIRAALNGSHSRLIFEFPESGTVSYDSWKLYIPSIVNIFKAIYVRSREHPVLIFSPEGYRGNTLFALLYAVYCTAKPLSAVVVNLYRHCKRPILCSEADVHLVSRLQPVLATFSPSNRRGKYSEYHGAIPSKIVREVFTSKASAMLLSTISPKLTDESWFSSFRGSLPAQLLPHLYLGSLEHASNPVLLSNLGIRSILSVGEKLPWVNYRTGEYRYYNVEGIEEVFHIDDILDDGVDSLDKALDTCLDFLDRAYEKQCPTLVHCRVGVSRSAAVCIAEIMRRLRFSLPQAYLYVRVRRLNVIIQPNLRLMYDLAKYEERLNHSRGSPRLRQMDWPALCCEIARINTA